MIASTDNNFIIETSPLSVQNKFSYIIWINWSRSWVDAASGKREFQVKKILFSYHEESSVSPFRNSRVEKVSRTLMVPLATRGKLVPATLSLSLMRFRCTPSRPGTRSTVRKNLPKLEANPRRIKESCEWLLFWRRFLTFLQASTLGVGQLNELPTCVVVCKQTAAKVDEMTGKIWII